MALVGRVGRCEILVGGDRTRQDRTGQGRQEGGVRGGYAFSRDERVKRALGNFYVVHNQSPSREDAWSHPREEGDMSHVVFI